MALYIKYGLTKKCSRTKPRSIFSALENFVESLNLGKIALGGLAADFHVRRNQ